jgi:hypothetical protein
MKLWAYEFTGTPRECLGAVVALLNAPPADLPPEHLNRYRHNVGGAEADLNACENWPCVWVRGYGTGGEWMSSGVHLTQIKAKL